MFIHEDKEYAITLTNEYAGTRRSAFLVCERQLDSEEWKLNSYSFCPYGFVTNCGMSLVVPNLISEDIPLPVLVQFLATLVYASHSDTRSVMQVVLPFSEVLLQKFNALKTQTVFEGTKPLGVYLKINPIANKWIVLNIRSRNPSESPYSEVTNKGAIYLAGITDVYSISASMPKSECPVKKYPWPSKEHSQEIRDDMTGFTKTIKAFLDKICVHNGNSLNQDVPEVLRKYTIPDRFGLYRSDGYLIPYQLNQDSLAKSTISRLGRGWETALLLNHSVNLDYTSSPFDANTSYQSYSIYAVMTTMTSGKEPVWEYVDQHRVYISPVAKDVVIISAGEESSYLYPDCQNTYSMVANQFLMRVARALSVELGVLVLVSDRADEDERNVRNTILRGFTTRYTPFANSFADDWKTPIKNRNSDNHIKPEYIYETDRAEALTGSIFKNQMFSNYLDYSPTLPNQYLNEEAN